MPFDIANRRPSLASLRRRYGARKHESGARRKCRLPLSDVVGRVGIRLDPHTLVKVAPAVPVAA